MPFCYPGEQVDLSNVVMKPEAQVTFVNTAGDVMQGELDMNNNKVTNIADPTEDGDAVNLKTINMQHTTHFVYHDNYLQMNKPIFMSRHKITSLGDPDNDHDSTNKKYVDNAVSKISSDLVSLSSTVNNVNDSLTNLATYITTESNYIKLLKGESSYKGDSM
jgi:hypothetical protein